MTRGNPVVNRYLKDKAMDHIDHALGRPADPMKETYREYFATDADSELAAQFRASDHWEEAEKLAPGRMAYFYVTQAGRRALSDHLKAICEPHKTFIVTFSGYEDAVAAETHAKARYKRFLEVSDVCPDLTFAQFCRRSTVRVA